MKLLSFMLVSLLAIASVGQNPAVQNSGSPSRPKPQVIPGAIFRAELTKSIDAKKAKVGDEVMAETVEGFIAGRKGVVIPKGSKVIAHITSVSRHQGGSASTVSIAFDKVELKDGTDFALNATILEVGRPELDSALNTTSGLGGVVSPPGGGGNAGGMPVPGRTAPGVTPTQTEEPPTTTSHGGLVKVSGVSLSAGEGNVSTITSNTHDVKLDSGTEFVLRVTP